MIVEYIGYRIPGDDKTAFGAAYQRAAEDEPACSVVLHPEARRVPSTNWLLVSPLGCQALECRAQLASSTSPRPRVLVATYTARAGVTPALRG